jgi:hypothetical protein
MKMNSDASMATSVSERLHDFYGAPRSLFAPPQHAAAASRVRRHRIEHSNLCAASKKYPRHKLRMSRDMNFILLAEQPLFDYCCIAQMMSRGALLATMSRRGRRA